MLFEMYTLKSFNKMSMSWRIIYMVCSDLQITRVSCARNGVGEHSLISRMETETKGTDTIRIPKVKDW